MKNIRLSLLFLLPLCMGVCGCVKRETSAQYIIGVSQCSDDAWRTRMNEEMTRELIFHPELYLHIRQADDNSDIQCMQIDSFIAERVDLLVVSPNEAEEVKPAVSRAYDAGIPVIVADRQVSGEKWTAFVGGDNYAVGQLMAQWLISIAPAKGVLRVLEVQGLPGSTPMVARHKGMLDGLRGHTEVQIVGSACGSWFREEARVAVDSLLNVHKGIDAIVAQNDQMAIGACEVCRNRADAAGVKIMGVDGIVGQGGGVEALLRGQIDITATYPSRGDLVVQTAAHILKDEPYERHVVLPTLLIDRDAALPIQQIADEIDCQIAISNELETRLNRMWQMAATQRVALGTTVVLCVVVIVLLVVLLRVRAYRAQVEKEREANARLMAEQQRQLEDMTEALARTQAVQSIDERFKEQLQAAIERHLDESDFSVESLSTELHVSRAQLFRKTKALLGVAPVELIRSIRLRKAQELLRNTDLTIQQVAYMVGFVSPSYFSKCYREHFGVNPNSDTQSTIS